MDLEQLTKTQIILLTLLVSFVTSIATGVATVSLMEDAPVDVTRVISRIVEKPIETIIPGPTKTVERTVVVSERERIAEAVARAEQSVVRLYGTGSVGATDFKGFGIITSSDGTVITDARAIEGERADYVAVLARGDRVVAVPSETRGTLRLESSLVTPSSAFTPATFVPFDTLKLGETVVAISGAATTRISPGVITELSPANAGGSSRVRATIESADSALGTPLIDLEGRVVGMSEDIGSQLFLSLSDATPLEY